MIHPAAFPVLILILALSPTPAAGVGTQPPEGSPPEPSGESQGPPLPEPWRSGFEQIESDLRAGRWQAAGSAAARLAERMATLFPASPAGRVMVASALAQQAVAEAESGQREDALWHWQVAQNLNPGLGEASLAEAFGEAGAWLETHRLRVPGTLDAAPTPADAEVTPPAPLSVPYPEVPPELRSAWTSDSLDIEVVVDSDGRVRSPVVLGGGELPGKILFGLGTLRQWRFRPALADGVPTVSLLRLDGLAPSSFAFVVARSPRLGPVHRLLLEQRWQEAREAAQPLIDEALGCLAARPHHRSCGLGRSLVLRAVAEAGLGQAEDALWSWHLAASFRPLPAAGDVAVYGVEAGRLLAERPCAVEPLTCGAVALSDAGIIPPQAIATPPLRLPPKFAGQVGAERLVASLWIDAGGRVRGAVMRAGHSVAAGYLALLAVRDWRFEPARRGGEQVAVVYDVPIPLAAAAAAESPPGKVVLPPDADKLVRRAVKAARSDPRLAGCYWRAAMSLAPGLAAADPSSLGPAAAALAAVIAVPSSDRWSLDVPPGGDRAGPGSDPFHVGGDVERPRRISTPPPQYTPKARKARTEGVVITRVIIDEEGHVTSVEVLKGLPKGLNVETAIALCGWRFEPAARSGKPVSVFYYLTTNFRLR